jgi:hypothetical protein
LVRVVPAVCRTWHNAGHDLLREHATLLLSRLPPPHQYLHCTSLGAFQLLRCLPRSG